MSVNVCVCVHDVCLLCVYVCAHMRTCVCMSVCACAHAYAWMCVCVCVWVFTVLLIECTCALTYMDDIKKKAWPVDSNKTICLECPAGILVTELSW